MTRVLPAIVLALLAGCEVTGDDVVCTLEARAGINVTVVDQQGRPVTGAVGAARESEYRETLQSTGPGILFGAFERKGTYDVEVSARGYETWRAQRVTVRADECHVIPVRLTARLKPAS